MQLLSRSILVFLTIFAVSNVTLASNCSVAFSKNELSQYFRIFLERSGQNQNEALRMIAEEPLLSLRTRFSALQAWAQNQKQAASEITAVWVTHQTASLLRLGYPTQELIQLWSGVFFTHADFAPLDFSWVHLIAREFSKNKNPSLFQFAAELSTSPAWSMGRAHLLREIALNDPGTRRIILNWLAQPQSGSSRQERYDHLTELTASELISVLKSSEWLQDLRVNRLIKKRLFDSEKSELIAQSTFADLIKVRPEWLSDTPVAPYLLEAWARSIHEHDQLPDLQSWVGGIFSAKWKTIFFPVCGARPSAKCIRDFFEDFSLLKHSLRPLNPAIPEQVVWALFDPEGALGPRNQPLLHY